MLDAVVENRKLSDLGPVKRGYLIGPDVEEKTHYLSAPSFVDRRLLRELLPSSILRGVRGCEQT